MRASKFWHHLNPATKVWIILIPELSYGLLNGFQPIRADISTASWLLHFGISNLVSVATIVIAFRAGLIRKSWGEMVFLPQLRASTLLLDIAITAAVVFVVAALLHHLLYFFLWRFDHLIFSTYGVNPLEYRYPEKALWAVSALLIGPIFEELIFRGILKELFTMQSNGDLAKYGEWRYVFYSSLLFGACHWEQGPSVVVTTFFVGMLACKLYIRLGYLLPIIVAHCITNTLSLALS